MRDCATYLSVSAVSVTRRKRSKVAEGGSKRFELRPWRIVGPWFTFGLHGSQPAFGSMTQFAYHPGGLNGYGPGDVRSLLHVRSNVTSAIVLEVEVFLLLRRSFLKAFEVQQHCPGFISNASRRAEGIIYLSH